MHPDLARAGLVFLNRVELKGQEAIVFIEFAKEIEAMANLPPATIPANDAQE